MTVNFEWDEEKASLNLKKHEISFNEAKTIFEDPSSITLDNPIHSQLKTRFLIIGYSRYNRLLLVVYTEREENIRIISARKVTSGERELYEQDNVF